MNLGLSLLLTLCSAAPVDEDRQTVVVVVGAPGAAEYGEAFTQWADRWEHAAQEAGAELIRIGDKESDEQATDLDRLKDILSNSAKRKQLEPLWLVLIGHGTFDGKVAKFNLRGPDVSAQLLADWLEGGERPVAIINCASSSGVFINRLSAENRVVVTGAKSGFEQNYARFGDYLSAAIADPDSDLDKDQQTSLLEAFLSAAAKVEQFYQAESRLATEHALVDDNGDGKGTPADWFRGVSARQSAQQGAELDGSRAHQFHLVRSDRERELPPEVRAQRDKLEQDVIQLRRRKSELGEDDYYRQLETILVELARLYEGIDSASPK